MKNSTIRRSTGAGRKSHPLKGNAATITLRLYPIDRAYLEFKYKTITQALNHLCSGEEYKTYLRQQIEAMGKPHHAEIK